MSGSQDTLSSLQWQEPIDGLEPGELLLGTIASAYFSRGWFPGFGFGLTDRRIIGFKMRLISRVVEAPILAAIIVLYVAAFFESFSQPAGESLLILLPVVLAATDAILRFLTRRLSNRIISKQGDDSSGMLLRKRDFELRKDQIEEFLMKSPGRGLNLGANTGYLKISPKDHSLPQITVKIHEWNKSQRLRDLVITFTSRDPKVRALEYPPG